MHEYLQKEENKSIKNNLSSSISDSNENKSGSFENNNDENYDDEVE